MILLTCSVLSCKLRESKWEIEFEGNEKEKQKLKRMKEEEEEDGSIFVACFWGANGEKN